MHVSQWHTVAALSGLFKGLGDWEMESREH